MSMEGRRSIHVINVLPIIVEKKIWKTTLEKANTTEMVYVLIAKKVLSSNTHSYKRSGLNAAGGVRVN